MFDYEERKYQLDILVCSDCIYRSTCKVIRNSYCWKIIGLISQEKSMIEQAVKNFAIKLFSHLEGYENNEKLRDTFNDVLEEYGVEI